MDTPAVYFWARFVLGVAGTWMWWLVCNREYRDAAKLTTFDERLRTMLLVSFPLIYSAAYTVLSAYNAASSEKTPDPFQLIVATSVQVFAALYAIALLSHRSRASKS